jgi:hypothetical protein
MALEKTSSQMHLRKCNDLLGEIVEFPSWPAHQCTDH